MKIENILEGKSRDDMFRLLVELSSRFWDVRRYIVESEELDSGRVDGLVAKLKAEIEGFIIDEDSYNHWDGEGILPDLSHLEEQLRGLVDRGYANEAVMLGDELWRRADTLMEGCEYDEPYREIISCMHIALDALRQSSLSPPDQLLWAINKSLEDNYSLMDGADEFIRRSEYTSDDWREVTITLKKQLQSMPKPSESDDYYSRYRREKLLKCLLDCYERVGWKDKIIPLLEEEADACQCYDQLAAALLKARKRDRARYWCIHGYQMTRKDSPGIASTLQKRLQNMARGEGRYDMAAVYQVQEFFGDPSSANFQKLCKAAQKAGCLAAVRDAAMHYLETGKEPKLSTWPLPTPELVVPAGERLKILRQFPDFKALIDIAILEKRLDDVVSLYRRLDKTERMHGYTDKKVAEAVAETHPDTALKIWEGIVNELIDQVKPKAYEGAGGYLRLMRKAYEDNRRDEDWRALIDKLRMTHRQKRRLMEVLDRLSKKKS